MQPEHERRLRHLWLNPRMIVEWLTANPLDCACVAVLRAIDLPKDARVLSVFAETMPATIGLIVEHPSFEPVPPGQPPPRVELYMEMFRVHRFKDELDHDCLAAPGTAENLAFDLIERIRGIGCSWSMLHAAIRNTLLSYGKQCREELEEHIAKLQDIIKGLTARVAAQSELLSKKAERPAREAELEQQVEHLSAMLAEAQMVKEKP